MDKRTPIRVDIDAGERGSDPASDAAERFRDVFARWAASVAIMAVRDGTDVYATTVSSFAPVSARPPLLVVSLGAGAQVLPFAGVGAGVGLSLLGEDQSRWASVFSDSFPVARPEWPESGVPRIPGAIASLSCTVTDVHPVEGGSRLLVCRVDEVSLDDRDRPLIYWQRGYRRLDPD